MAPAGRPKGSGDGDTRALVAALTEQGRTATEIAARLGITTKAVYWHLKRINEE